MLKEFANGSNINNYRLKDSLQTVSLLYSCLAWQEWEHQIVVTSWVQWWTHQDFAEQWGSAEAPDCSLREKQQYTEWWGIVVVFFSALFVLSFYFVFNLAHLAHHQQVLSSNSHQNGTKIGFLSSPWLSLFT